MYLLTLRGEIFSTCRRISNHHTVCFKHITILFCQLYPNKTEKECFELDKALKENIEYHRYLP